jgi:hypothetical protein
MGAVFDDERDAHTVGRVVRRNQDFAAAVETSMETEFICEISGGNHCPSCPRVTVLRNVPATCTLFRAATRRWAVRTSW